LVLGQSIPKNSEKSYDSQKSYKNNNPTLFSAEIARTLATEFIIVFSHFAAFVIALQYLNLCNLRSLLVLDNLRLHLLLRIPLQKRLFSHRGILGPFLLHWLLLDFFIWIIRSWLLKDSLSARIVWILPILIVWHSNINVNYYN